MNANKNKGLTDTASLRERIPDQAHLPAAVAWGVVLQGFRIRLGRSMVTLTGIVCGIAFLMSIMTGHLIKQSVAVEDGYREEVDRIGAFIKSDLPALSGKAVQVIGSGTLSEVEIRVLERMIRSFGADVYFDESKSPEPTRKISEAKIMATASPAVVMVMGDGKVPQYDWESFFASGGSAMAAITTAELSAASLVGVEYSSRVVMLSRKMAEGELAHKASEAKKDRFRTIWILTISVLVTVIGITNAMLMSVTERFREIGTMKCLGALSSFIMRMFVMESGVLGFFGGLGGAVLGAVFSIAMYSLIFGAEPVLTSLPFISVLLYGAGGVVAGMLLSIISAIYPARVAAAMVPSTALRSTV